LPSHISDPRHRPRHTLFIFFFAAAITLTQQEMNTSQTFFFRRCHMLSLFRFLLFFSPLFAMPLFDIAA